MVLAEAVAPLLEAGVLVAKLVVEQRVLDRLILVVAVLVAQIVGLVVFLAALAL